MSRLILCVTTLAATILLLSGCGRSEHAWTDLPSSPEMSYTASIRTYGSDYADKPFDVQVKSKIPPRHENVVLRAIQCKNVRILPKADYIYIFYDELVLAGYSSNQFDASLPRPFLCDVRHTFCGNMLKAAVSAKEPVSIACSHS